MKIKSEIESILREEFTPKSLEVIDESYKHAGHREAGEAIESHFKLKIDRNSVLGEKTLEKHRNINKVLNNIVRNKIHALEIVLL